MLGYLGALIPSERAAQVGRKGSDCRHQPVSDGFGPVVLGKMQQHHVTGGSFHQGSDRGPAVRSQDVGSDRSALPAFELVGFSGPPAEPDVRLSPHPALHRFMPLVRVILPSWRSPMVWGFWCAGSDIE